MKSLCLDKKLSYLYENNMLQQVREYPLITSRILNILHTKDRYNIKLNAYA